MLKRFTYLVVVLSLLLGASCSSNQNNAEPTKSETQEQLTPASQTAAETTVEPTQEPSVTATAAPTEPATNTPVPPTATSLPTSTLTPTSIVTPTPTMEPTLEVPSASVTLAQAAVDTMGGSTVTVDRVETIEMILVGDKDDPNPETKQYTLAYDENGMIVARFSAENGGEGQWIAGGPFADEEINDGLSNFPCTPNGFNYCGVGVYLSSFIEYGLHTDGTAIQLLDGQGNPTPFFMEAGVIGYYIDAHGEQQTIMIPIMIANENTDQRTRLEQFQETPLPEWQFSDHITRFGYSYYITHSNFSTYYDDPNEINYWFDENAIMPELGFGDKVIMAFPIPGRETSGNKEFVDTYAFLQPLISSYYFSNQYSEFLSTGDVSLLEDDNINLMWINGVPLVIPSSALIWDVDVYR